MQPRLKPILQVLSLILTFLFCPITNAEPINLALAKNDAKNYHDSGLYQEELAAKIKKAQEYIIQQAIENQHSKRPKKLAVVLDIDETSISNYDKMVQRDFAPDLERIHQEIMAADAPAIKSTLALYQKAIQHGVKVFFVTGRREFERDATRKNLLQAGYKGWTGLYLRPQDYSQHSIMPFKSNARAKIIKRGYTIVASIGDQYSDILGGNTLKGFKLPNPYYYLP